MASINVNVSVEELRKLSNYVANFKKYIDGDCAQLESATRCLEATMDEESVYSISQTVKEIGKLLDEKGPELEKLAEKINNYADFVERLKAAAGN